MAPPTGKKKTIRIGSRASQLALWQANWVKRQIEGVHPQVEAEIVRIKTSGDMILDVPLAQVGGKGLFVKEIEEALLDGRIDLAVHSMKDVPVLFPEGLGLAVISEREDAHDAFISPNGRKLAHVPPGASIGTSSLRRQAQLLNARPDLQIVAIRGNVETRLRKIRELSLGGAVLAAAGMKRLGFKDMITELLSFEVSLPAIGQGALGIEIRLGDMQTSQIVSHINHDETSIAVSAERAFLRRLEGGCQVPIAAFGRVEKDQVHLDGFVGSTDGKRVVRQALSAPVGEAEALGTRLAEELLGRGAGDILAEVYGSRIE